MSDALAALVAAAAETVARHFDDDAFACDFGGQTAINLPNLDVVIPLAAIPPGAALVTEDSLAKALHDGLVSPGWTDAEKDAAAILAALREPA